MVWSLKKANAALNKAAFVCVLSSAQSNQTHWNGSKCKLSKLVQQKWQATIINYHSTINISNPSHIQSTDVFHNPNVISVPSLDALGFVLDVLDSMAGCWFCRIRDPLTGAVLRASGKKDSRNEDRDASLGLFHGFFSHLRREGLVLLWGEEFGITPDWTYVCQPQKARWLKMMLLLMLNLSWKVFCSSCCYFWLTVWKGFMGVWGHNFEKNNKNPQKKGDNPVYFYIPTTTCYLVTLHILQKVKFAILIREPCESTPASSQIR